jgi:hypothetical protein
VLRPATIPRDLEAPARAALEARAGRPLTNEEWENAKHDLLAMFRLLKTWSAPIAPNTERPARTVLSLAIADGSG